MKLSSPKGILFILTPILLGLFLSYLLIFTTRPTRPPVEEKISITPTAPPSATPTPRFLTFFEMNALYGPCVNLPVLMYHHVQKSETAKANGNSGLTVTPTNFEKHLAYLNDQGYTSIIPSQLISFFDSGVSLPNKPVMLTFDDGYDDFANYAAPLLSRFGIKASMYLPTGLLGNPGYLGWDTINSLAQQGFYFGNHTWSHHSLGANNQANKKEIITAQRQLSDHGLDPLKVFVYPYGTTSTSGVNVLRELGYSLAFTTQPGRIVCAKQRLTIPRIRIGNAALSAYGL